LLDVEVMGEHNVDIFGHRVAAINWCNFYFTATLAKVDWFLLRVALRAERGMATLVSSLSLCP